MKLSYVINQLRTGELTQLSIGTATLDSAAIEQMVNVIQLGLTDLYTRFLLKKGQLSVTLDPDETEYPLAAPDLIQVERVLADSGEEFSINERSNPLSLRMASMGVLSVPQVILDQGDDLPPCYLTKGLKIEYRADHPTISLTDLNPDAVQLELPMTHLWALLMFVASRYHNPVGMGQEFNAGNTYWSKYERACQELELEGIELSDQDQPSRLHLKGFV